MDLSALKNAALGIRIPARPDLSAFSQEQRDALQPLVESMEAVGRLVEGIRSLPDAEPSVAAPVVPPQTRVLGAEPESQAVMYPKDFVAGTADYDTLYWDNTDKVWKLLAGPDTDYKVLQRKADDTIGWDYVRAH